MDTSKQELIVAAKQELIVAIQASMNATKKCMDCQTDAGLMTAELYKSYMDQLNEQRLSLLELTGEIPKRKLKSRHYAFGSRR